MIRRRNVAVADEIGTLQRAVDGVRMISEWAYEQTDQEARRALPKILAVTELISDRMLELHRRTLGE